MTHKIRKSELTPSYQDARDLFGRLVETFIREMQAWREHDAKVRAQSPLRPPPKPAAFAAEEDPSTAYWRAVAMWQAEKRARFEPYPKPIVHPDIVAAVTPVFGADGKIAHVPDFEIVDD
jgi:hypothetical protein